MPVAFAIVFVALPIQAKTATPHPLQRLLQNLESALILRAWALIKRLLQNLESALILRAGFLAGVFHSWRLQGELTRYEEEHRQELEQHHDAWAAHFQQHQMSFQETLAKHAEHQMTAKEKRRQQADLIISQWAAGDAKGTCKQALRSWSHYALQERRAKRASSRITQMIYGWAEGKTKGTGRACFQNWKMEALSSSAERKREADLAKLAASHADEQARRDAEMAAKLAEIEGRKKDRTSGVEAVMANWAKGKVKGTAALCWKHWSDFAKAVKSRARRHEAVKLQMMKWAEGEAKGTARSVWLCWKHEAKANKIARQAEQAAKEEAKRLEMMLADEQRKNGELHQTAAQILADKKAAAKRQIEYIAAKWAGGANKGAKSGIFKGWHSYVKDAKAKGRKNQAVHAALTKALLGEAKGAAKTALLNWHMLTKDEKAMRKREEDEKQANAKLAASLQEKEAELQKHLLQLQAAGDSAKARAQHATQMVLKKWLGGDRTGLLKQFWQDWITFIQEGKQAAMQRESVKESVMRFILSDQRGLLYSCVNSWMNYVRFEAKQQRLHEQQQQKMMDLQAGLDQAMKKQEVQMLRAAEAFAGKQGPVLMGMAYRAWHDLSMGERAREEAERERLVALEEMELQREQEENRRNERIARALDGMGCKRTRVILNEYFSAWALLWDTEKLEKMQKLAHNSQMQAYSEYMLGKNLARNAATLLANSFKEWHMETKERLRLEQERDDLQEQLQLYYQQIDLITETLQKELQTKEELASELRDAYDKMRQQSKAQVPLTTPSTMASLDSRSRTSSVEGRRKETTQTPKGARTLGTPRTATAATVGAANTGNSTGSAN
ncbi:hypothetical protein AK812_SmicGene2199 [Symbiodinium microadriaticum]|uniref:Uncharacterized protein n=1 Tax=Symbiodinium microadriaticum TaxID=2951 RepID=A0A1Q9F230_SYMMI|nr:hypothetical protein AK812_SmicGene2199 [Symbiodinium microadriaticum]